VSGTVSAAARKTGHLVSFIITLVMMIVLVAYTAYHSRTRELPRWSKYGPLVLTVVASFLIMAEPTRHIVTDHNLWADGAMYRDDCDTESVRCLSFVGWMFELCTWFGFTFLIVGSLWNANIVDKIRELRWRWQEIRNQSAAAEPEEAVQSDQPYQRQN